MNLNAIVGPLVSAITPSVPAMWHRSLGYTTAANGTRVPSYAMPVCISIAVQALTGPDLDHVDAMNLQGVKRAAYVNGQIEGVNRPALKGGDLFTFDAEVWLVGAVLEPWQDWTKVALVLQSDAA